jgi:hypothetical protein
MLFSGRVIGGSIKTIDRGMPGGALPLFEATPGELARFRAHAASEYADFAPSYQHYGEIFRQRLIERARAT